MTDETMHIAEARWTTPFDESLFIHRAGDGKKEGVDDRASNSNRDW